MQTVIKTPPLGWWMGRGLAIFLACLPGVLFAGSSTLPAPAPFPSLVIEPTVADDFAALATTTWQQFLAVFAPRSACFGSVHLRADPHLQSRAAYDPTTATVTVRVPGTPAFLREALVHEWAHHVEFQCPEHLVLRPAFLMAMGRPADTAWFQGDSWETIPSEHYAEATVELVLGRRQILTAIHVTPAMVAVVQRWSEGLELPPTSPTQGRSWLPPGRGILSLPTGGIDKASLLQVFGAGPGMRACAGLPSTAPTRVRNLWVM